MAKARQRQQGSHGLVSQFKKLNLNVNCKLSVVAWH